MLTSKAIEFLKVAGWTENRKIDISRYENALQKEGYIINKVIRDFLISFGGLKIKHPHHGIQNKEEEFHLDPILAISGIYPEKIEEYNKRTGSILTVIGEASNRYLVLMMAEQGAVYAAYDDFLIFLGESGEEAIVTLCEGKQATEIP